MKGACAIRPALLQTGGAVMGGSERNLWVIAFTDLSQIMNLGIIQPGLKAAILREPHRLERVLRLGGLADPYCSRLLTQ